MPHYEERLDDQLRPAPTVWHCHDDGSRHLVPRDKAIAEVRGNAGGERLKDVAFLAGAAAIGWWLGGTKGLIAGVLAPHLLEMAGWRKPQPGPEPPNPVRQVGAPLPPAETRTPETPEQQAIAGVLRAAGFGSFGL